MKTKFLQFALIAFTALSIISCSKDDDNKSEQAVADSVTIDGKTESITNSYGTLVRSNYAEIGFETFNEENAKVGDTFSGFYFRMPINAIGEKIPLVEIDRETKYYYVINIFEITSVGKVIFLDNIFDSNTFDIGNLEGTNNWVQFKAVDKSKNIYRVEFEFTAKGKVFKGNYTTEFKVQN